MKLLSNLIHRTPWWLLLAGGLLTLAALAVFVTPFHLIGLEKTGSTPEERLAIKREIDYTFSSGAIDVARNIVREIRAHTKDPARREELDRALEEIDQARDSLDQAGAEVIRAKREAAAQVTSAVKEASQAIEEAQKRAEQALKEAGVKDERVTKSLDESLKAAREAEAEARRSEAEARAKRAEDRAQQRARRVDDIKRRFTIGKSDRGGPKIDIDLAGVPPGTARIATPLPPEVRADIHEKVNRDLRRIGIGAGALLLFVPLFILTIVSKIFIDRSRAAQEVAESERREAEFHRMSQQVTEAKLQALQAQVEPHFLYNTLASVQALTEVDPERASQMTGHLIQYLRNALPKMRESVSTVAQEIELVRAYLNILQMRMGERLAFEIEVPPDLANAPFPPLMLPSLVENAIKHGLEPQREGGIVRIRAEERDGKLRVIVADTGRGFTDALGAGVGLANIRERLHGLYGEAGKLTLEANSPQGVIATIEVPREPSRVASASPTAAVPPVAPKPAMPGAPPSAARRTLAAMGAAERVWRKGLSFTFLALVIVAAVFAGLAIVAVIAGEIPVQYGGETIGGTTGALIGSAAIIAAFGLVVIALAIVIAVFYGLGFLVVGLAVFIPLVVLVSLVPALAPFILFGLVIWWLVRRSQKKKGEAAAEPERKEPTVGTAAPK